MKDLKISSINRAYSSINKHILKTPLITNEKINNLTGGKIYFKLENLQITGSFKIRGATYKISLLTKEEKKRGVVAYSSGNHAQAVAYASRKANIKSTIVMPANAPKIKIYNTRNFGAKVLLYNPFSNKREEIAEQIAKKRDLTLIKPYDDYDIIAGQGTVGKEIVNQLNELDLIPDIYLCCVSGGGLIAGSSFYLKKNFPFISCYSVEPKYFDDTLKSLNKKKIISNKKSVATICDALVVPQPGNITFSINKNILKKGLSVSDSDVKKTIKFLAEELKLTVEPGGAVSAAAILAKKINTKGKNVVVMISGGNIDYDLFSKLIK